MLLALTGATGPIGQHLLQELLEARLSYTRALCAGQPRYSLAAASAVVGDPRPARRICRAALAGVDAVIHSAVDLAHAMSGVPEDDSPDIQH